MQTFQFICSVLLIIAAVSIFLTENPVYSVLLLILCFCISSIILFSFNAEFLGLIFIMVYVGAVAVLFLFVIMMIDTKKIPIKKLSTQFYLIVTSVLVICYFFLNTLLNNTFFNIDDKELNTHIYIRELKLISQTTTERIGQALFNEYSIAVLIAGFVLLVALIGAVCLTVDFKEEEGSTRDKSYKQNAKTKSSTNDFK
jgi:NADH-quinone oxidoreductase subunit J